MLTSTNNRKSFKGANRITCAPLIVNSVDTLHVSLWLDWFTPDFFEELNEKRKLAQELDIASVIVNFDNQQWSLHRSAPGYFRFRLTSGDITVLLSSHKTSSSLSNCRIEIGSLSCWAGCHDVFRRVKKMINSMGSDTKKEIVSRVDLAADLVGIHVKDTNIHDEDFWICKARDFSLYRRNRKLTGIAYGKKNIMLRVYDKVAELKKNQATNKQEQFSKIWGVENYEEKPVTRVEFQLRRSALKDFNDSARNVDTVDSLFRNMSSIWKYCTKDWARHCHSVVDRNNNNQKQAKTSPFWRQVKKATWKGYGRLKRWASPVRKNIQALKDQMRGIAVTLVSSTGLEHHDYFGIMSTASEMLSQELHKYMVGKEPKFKKLFDQRRSECLMAC
jgi:hypothetical protein